MVSAAAGDLLAKDLSREEWYHGLLPREDMNSLLRRNGDFLVRFSEAKKGQDKSFILSVMAKEQMEKDGIKHYVITRTAQGKFMIERFGFATVKAMVAHHLSKNDSLVRNEEVRLLTPIKRQDWEHSHDDVTITKKLGEGAFGEVSLGKLRVVRGPLTGKTVDVAVKLAKLETLTKEQIKEIMSEARLMRRFDHPNVVKFYGVATLQEPLMVIMELASNGALDGFLQKNKSLPVEKLNEMVMQAAWGVDYIHRKTVLHRDIAARNCLYGGGNVKIADFGLSREGNCYQMDAHTRVPIRWLAPETISTAFFTQKTDVWAFGVMSWEIYNYGIEPYPGMGIPEVATSVRQGFRLEFPSAVRGDVASFFRDSVWHEDPASRPTMPDIVRSLENFFQMTFKKT